MILIPRRASRGKCEIINLLLSKVIVSFINILSLIKYCFVLNVCTWYEPYNNSICISIKIGLNFKCLSEGFISL